MESISDVVDEVIQNCPIDVRRPLYKVRAAQANAVAPGPRHGARGGPRHGRVFSLEWGWLEGLGLGLS